MSVDISGRSTLVGELRGSFFAEDVVRTGELRVDADHADGITAGVGDGTTLLVLEDQSGVIETRTPVDIRSRVEACDPDAIVEVPDGTVHIDGLDHAEIHLQGIASLLFVVHELSDGAEDADGLAGRVCAATRTGYDQAGDIGARIVVDLGRYRESRNTPVAKAPGNGLGEAPLIAEGRGQGWAAAEAVTQVEIGIWRVDPDVG